jgi:hypothetical protein
MPGSLNLPESTTDEKVQLKHNYIKHKKVFTGIQHEKLLPFTWPLMDCNRFKLTNKENRILKNKAE